MGVCMEYNALRFHLFKLVWLLAAYFVAGCIHQRTMCVASVGDIGPEVKTRYRYRSANNDLESRMIFGILKKAHPNVFADDGIPFVVRSMLSHPVEMSTVKVPFALSLFALPICFTEKAYKKCSVEIANMPDARMEFSTCYRRDNATSMWTPLPMLFYMGNTGNLGDEKEFNGARIFCEHDVRIGFHSKIDLINAAYAYGLAVSLKKMEDEGLIDLWRHQNSKFANDNSVCAGAVTSAFSGEGSNLELLSFEREEGNDFVYRFKLRSKTDGMTLRESSKIRNTMVKIIRDDYLVSNPYAVSSMLVVDFPVYELKGADVEGRAVVICLDVRSLSYDPNTRRGIMKIRLEAGQFAEAREYVRRNIEMIVRDKCIALEDGRIPDAATFRLLDEKMTDGVLEMSFKVE